MTTEQQADDVQAVIDALAERERYVWVMITKWSDETKYIEGFSTKDKAVADAKEYVSTLSARAISLTGQATMREALSAPGDPLLAEVSGALSLSIEIMKVPVQ